MANKGPCEAIVGWDNTGPAPFGVKCHQPGQERGDYPVLHWVPILCDQCWAKIQERQK